MSRLCFFLCRVFLHDEVGSYVGLRKCIMCLIVESKRRRKHLPRESCLVLYVRVAPWDTLLVDIPLFRQRSSWRHVSRYLGVSLEGVHLHFIQILLKNKQPCPPREKREPPSVSYIKMSYPLTPTRTKADRDLWLILRGGRPSNCWGKSAVKLRI